VAGYRIAATCATAARRSIRLPVAQAIDRAIGSGLTEERAYARGNLARVLPEASSAVLNASVGENCANFAACFADLPTLNRRRPDAWLPSIARVDGTDRLEAVFAAHRSAILLTARRGKWLNFFEVRGVPHAAS
jgi:lauroyl/myristoyl acyltransferase